MKRRLPSRRPSCRDPHRAWTGRANQRRHLRAGRGEDDDHRPQCGYALAALVTLVAKSMWGRRSEASRGQRAALILFGAWTGHVRSGSNRWRYDDSRRSRGPQRRGGRHAESHASAGLHDWHRGRFGCIFMASVCVGGEWQDEPQARRHKLYWWQLLKRYGFSVPFAVVAGGCALLRDAVKRLRLKGMESV